MTSMHSDLNGTGQASQVNTFHSTGRDPTCSKVKASEPIVSLEITCAIMDNASLVFVLKKDRVIVVTALLILCALSWIYIIYLYNQMHPMNMDAILFAMPMTPNWSSTDFILLFIMWLVMMIAMMTPSVAP